MFQTIKERFYKTVGNSTNKRNPSFKPLRKDFTEPWLGVEPWLLLGFKPLRKDFTPEEEENIEKDESFKPLRKDFTCHMYTE